MTLKFYTLFTLLFIVLLGNFVWFFVTDASIPLNIADIHLASYPIAIWVTLPFFLFYLLNVIMMSVSSLQNYFKLRNYSRDFDKLKEAVYNAMLNKPKVFEFKTKRYKLLGDLVTSSVITPRDDAIIEDNEKLQSAVDMVQKVSRGEYLDIKPFGLAKDNPLTIQNAKNRLKSDGTTSLKLLENSSYYDDATIKEAYATYVKEATLADVIKFKKFVSIRSLLFLLNRVNNEEHPIEIDFDTLLDLTRHVTREINPLGYLELSMAVRTVLVPDERIRLFETLLEDGVDVNESLLYTFLDLEMVEKARELLENFTEDDFPRYRAFLALKEINYSCNIDLLI